MVYPSTLNISLRSRRRDGHRRREWFLRLLIGSVLTSVTFQATAAMVNGDYYIDGYYPDDGFIINPNGRLILRYNGSVPFDYGRGTFFEGNGTLVKTGTGTVFWGAQTSTFRMTSAAWIDVQQGTLVGGSHGNENWTSNQSGLRVSAGATFAGVEANVQVGGLEGNGTITSGYNGYGYTGFYFGSFTSVAVNTFGGVLANSPGYAGKYIKRNWSTQILTGANTFTGGLEIRQGTVQLGNGGTTGSLASNVHILGQGTLAFNRSNTYTFSNTITSQADNASPPEIIQRGTGVVALTGNNSGFSGNLVMDKGAIQFSNLNNLGNSKLQFSGGALRWAPGNTLDISHRFSGDNNILRLDTNGNNVTFATSFTTQGLIKQGEGVLSLAAPISLYNDPKIEGGILRLVHSGALSVIGTTMFIDITANGTLDLNGIDRYNMGGTLGIGKIIGSREFLGASGTYANAYGGTGKMTLTGNVTLTGQNTFSGGLNVQDNARVEVASESQLGSGSILINRTASVNVKSNADLSRYIGSGHIYANSYSFNSAADHSSQVRLGTYSGYSNVVKEGKGMLAVEGMGDNFRGTVFVRDGTLMIRNGWRSDIFYQIAENGVLDVYGQDFVINDNFGGSGTISGLNRFKIVSSLVWLNLAGSASVDVGSDWSGTTQLLGNNTFTGGLYIQRNGSVIFFSSDNLGDGTVHLHGGNLHWGSNADISSKLNVMGGRLNLSGSRVEFASSFRGTGVLDVSMAGGTLILAAENEFSGFFQWDGGTVRIAHDRALANAHSIEMKHQGSLAIDPGVSFSVDNLVGSGSIMSSNMGADGAENGTLVFSRLGFSHSLGSFLVTGNLNVVMNGDETLNLGQQYRAQGDIFVNSGRVLINSEYWANLPAQRVVVAEGATFDTRRGSLNITNFEGTGIVFVNDGSLLYHKQSSTGISVLENELVGATGGFNIEGRGLHLLITGNNRYYSITSLGEDTTVIMGHDNALGLGPMVHLKRGSTLDIAEHKFNLLRLQGAAELGTLTSSGGGTFYYDNPTPFTVRSPITGSATVTVDGGGTLFLEGNNTHTGGFHVKEGMVNIGANSLGTGNITLDESGIAEYHGNLNLNRILGTGQFMGSGRYHYDSAAHFTSSVRFDVNGAMVKSGSGTLTLKADNRFGMNSRVDEGKLVVNGKMLTPLLTVKSELGGGGSVQKLHLDAGSTIAPGNSIGTFTAEDTLWTAGSTYQWEVENANGEAGEGYDHFFVDGRLTFDAGDSPDAVFTIQIVSLDETGQAGFSVNFDEEVDYRFILATASEGISFDVLPVFAIDTDSFLNSFSGSWSVHAFENTIELHYIAQIPEPGTVMMICGGAVGLYLSTRRRRV